MGLWDKFIDWTLRDDPEMQVIDERIERVNQRIAAKEQYLKELTETVETMKDIVSESEKTLDSLKKTINKNSN